ncbi:hypothetical protein HQ585_17005 [candidate division KSB1 bacterium]|nr:hypothetical protein [candidate division KSB1 bacterium]
MTFRVILPSFRFIVLVFLLIVFQSCEAQKVINTKNKAYKNGYAEGYKNAKEWYEEKAYKKGYDEGYQEGYNEGIIKAGLKERIVGGHVSINMDELDRIVAEIKYSHNPSSSYKIPVKEAVISNKFEAYSIIYNKRMIEEYTRLMLDKRPKMDKNHYYGFFQVQDSYLLEDSNQMLVVMRSVFGWEFIPYVFAIFEIDGVLLSLKGLVEELYGASLGKLTVEAIIKVEDKGHLLIGKNIMSDEGRWESVWIDLLSPSFSIRKLYEKGVGCEPMEDSQRIEYTLDKEQLKMQIMISERKYLGGNDFSEWSLIEQEDVDLKELIVKEN